jgi:hypothetical protein
MLPPYRISPGQSLLQSFVRPTACASWDQTGRRHAELDRSTHTSVRRHGPPSPPVRRTTIRMPDLGRRVTSGSSTIV